MKSLENEINDENSMHTLVYYDKNGTPNRIVLNAESARNTLHKISELSNHLDTRENWLPERLHLHDNILAIEQEYVIRLSERLGELRPTMYLLRGNTASGKTTALRTHPLFRNALDPFTNQPSGTINTDIYKKYLKDDAKEFVVIH